MSDAPTQKQETVDPASETELRDERRAQLIGECWLGEWIKKGRNAEGGGCDSWVKGSRAAEAREYEWIWVPPYLQREADDDLDRYRAQRAGTHILQRLATTVHTASNYWFDRASEHVVKTNEQWLLLAGIMEIDGWQQVALKDGTTVWTKEPPPAT